MNVAKIDSFVSIKDFDFRQVLRKMDDAKKYVKELDGQLESFCKQFTEIERYKPKETSRGKIEALPVLKIPEGYEVEQTARIKTINKNEQNVLWFAKKDAKGYSVDRLKVIVESLSTYAIDTDDIKTELPFNTYYILYPGRIKFKVILGYIERGDESNVYTIVKDIDEEKLISALEKIYKKE